MRFRILGYVVNIAIEKAAAKGFRIIAQAGTYGSDMISREELLSGRGCPPDNLGELAGHDCHCPQCVSKWPINKIRRAVHRGLKAGEITIVHPSPAVLISFMNRRQLTTALLDEYYNPFPYAHRG